MDQFAEIRDEMLLRAEISRLKTFNVGLVKGLELQGPPLADAGVSASVAPRDGTGAGTGVERKIPEQLYSREAAEMSPPHANARHTLKEIAAILGISIETARVRLKRARREIGHLGDSGATGHAR